jgi:hypothetical protein
MKPISMKEWGKDHWSTFAYVEDLAVNGKGLAVPDHRRMRTNKKTHPFMRNDVDGSMYPTRLKTREVKKHDDWDCIEDMISEGLITYEGTGLNPAYKLTKLGKEVASLLRKHKQEGKNFGEFKVNV